MTLEEMLKERGYPLCPLDGEFHRFARPAHKDNLNGWFKGRRLKVAGKELILARFGDWGAGESHQYMDEAASDVAAEAVAAELAQLDQEEQAEREARWAEAAAEAERIWAGCTEMGESPYFARKKVGPGLFGCRLDVSSEAAAKWGVQTIIPVRGPDGKLRGLQRISGDGQKFFLPGTQVKGSYHLIGSVDPEGVLYVCEGVATAASIHLARSSGVAAAFHAGNLSAVASELRRRFPQVQLVLAGDDDRWTKRADGTAWNPGREAALQAATASGGVAIVPEFVTDEGRPTDWNDLHCREGLERVREQLEYAEKHGRALDGPKIGTTQVASAGSGARGPYSLEGLVPLPWPMSGNKKKAPPQEAVAQRLSDWYGGNLVKQERDLFLYVGTHWKLLDQAALDAVYLQLQHLYSGQATSGQLKSMFELFCLHLASPPEGVDLFTPNPFCANFRNGTLFLSKGRDHAYTMEFRPHRAEDYLVNVLPYDYDAGRGARNEEFHAMLDRVFEGDEDKDEKIRAVRQMFGACLVPAFPHLFMLWGAPGTGKSTVLNIAARLVHADNLSRVAPSEFQGFNMETMAGKLVNLDTDIPFDQPMRDEIVKKVIERAPFRIRRKNIRDLYAPIPAVHLFGGNNLPRALDGVSKAHDRRWTFIEFKAFVPKGKYLIHYWDWCFEQSPQGILNFALEGLADLCAQDGHFLQPGSGKAKLEQWQLSTDPVGQFLADAANGEIHDGQAQLIVDPEGRVKRGDLWELYCYWHFRAYRIHPRKGKHDFFDTLRQKKIEEKTIKGVHHFAGYRSDKVPEGAKY